MENGQDLVTRLDLIESEPLEQRAEGYLRLAEQLRVELEKPHG